ncbi:hypothetical protein [Xenorhabdus bovienii]|uniref:hypothetical protein n=1 Tax=Xenorhabdus bovienii TaxID=40576 RepID=UPI0023B2E87D|nr:hypothetical protein [Xenorhabdus bovienii]MDE9455370.1 hypothetical protein [Xenorhabdus bovienii]MDE9566582.1 hypothetical protein [Xenorhabdus bovienii]
MTPFPVFTHNPLYKTVVGQLPLTEYSDFIAERSCPTPRNKAATNLRNALIFGYTGHALITPHNVFDVSTPQTTNLGRQLFQAGKNSDRTN